ncbi:MAG: carboxypeptidase-like regulatory domain-containing protein [Bacteroidia bacterium]
MKTKNILLHIASPCNFSISKYAMQLLLFCVLFTTAKAQVVAPIKDTLATQKDTNNYLQGVVLDKNNERLPFATVSIKNTSIHCETDLDGDFKMPIPTMFDSLNVEVSCVGYESKKFLIFPKKNVNIVLKLEKRKFKEGELMIMY